MQLPNEIKRNGWFKMGVPVKTAVCQLNSSRVKKRNAVNFGWEIFPFFSLDIYYPDRTKIPHSDAPNKAFTYPYLSSH